MYWLYLCYPHDSFIIHKWQTFVTVANLPRNGQPRKFISRPHLAIVRETRKKKTKVVHLRLYRPQLGRQILKLVMDLALTRMACLEGLPRKNQNTRLLEQ